MLDAFICDAIRTPIGCHGGKQRAGAIKPGHPLGMSGARIVQTLVPRLEDEGGRLAAAVERM